MLALSVALMAEAKPLIHAFRLKERPESRGYRIWENETMLLILSGSGKLFSASASSFLLGQEPSIDFFLNVGIAGHATEEIGSVFLANKVFDSTENKSYFPTFTFSPPCPTTMVTTVAKPTKEYPQDSCIDMEASGFCSAVSRFLPFELIHSLKVISDNRSFPHHLLTEKKVSDLLLAQCPLIELLIERSEPSRALHQEMKKKTVDPSLYLEKWHFTHSQKEKLKDILMRLRSFPKQEESLEPCKSAQEVLKVLEEKVKKSPYFPFTNNLVS